VSGEQDMGPGEVEWLDLGRPAAAEGSEGPRRRSRRGRLLVAAAVLLAAALVTVLAAPRPATRSAPRPGRAPTSAVSSVGLRRPVVPRSASARPVIVTEVGHRLMDVPPEWELFGLGPAGIVRIQLAAGRITRTAAPALDGGGAVALIVGPMQVIVRPADAEVGYQVRDGQPAAPLTDALADGVAAFPGPDPTHLWVQSSQTNQVTLVDLAGHPSAASVSFPATDGSVSGDGAGGLVFTDFSGAYTPGRDGLHRITSGALLAVGPTRWLAAECDQRHRCAPVVIDRATGARHVLGPARTGTASLASGVISPDGTTAALLGLDQTASPAFYLLDLASGRQTAMPAGIRPLGADGTFVWSPDSRWLFAASAIGQLSVIDRRTGHAHQLPTALPPINQLALTTTPRWP
jgi:hypothetical protein